MNEQIINEQAHETTEAEWVQVIQLALDSDLEHSLRNRVVSTLLDMRRDQIETRQRNFAVLSAMYSTSDPSEAG